MQANFKDDTGYLEALKDLETALKIDPENTELKAEYSKIQFEISKSRKNDQKIVKNFLSSTEKPIQTQEKKPDYRQEIVKINGLIQENLAAIKLFEKYRKPRRIEKCKKNIAKLEKMKSDIENNKFTSQNIDKMAQEIQQIAKQQGYFYNICIKRIDLNNEEILKEIAEIQKNNLINKPPEPIKVKEKHINSPELDKENLELLKIKSKQRKELYIVLAVFIIFISYFLINAFY